MAAFQDPEVMAAMQDGKLKDYASLNFLMKLWEEEIQTNDDCIVLLYHSLKLVINSDSDEEPSKSSKAPGEP